MLSALFLKEQILKDIARNSIPSGFTVLYVLVAIRHNVNYRATAHHLDAAQHGNHWNTTYIFY